MQAFTQLDGLVAPLDRANVDTDAIIPKLFLKSIKRSGFGPDLFQPPPLARPDFKTRAFEDRRRAEQPWFFS